MAETDDRSFLEALAAALDPYLSADAKRAARALRNILDLFPGQSLGEIEKKVRSLLASQEDPIPALAERARRFADGTATEPAAVLILAVEKLAGPDVKRLGESLGLALAGAKGKMVADLRAWLESGGATSPVSAKDRAVEKAKEYADGLAERMRQMDDQAADEIIARAEAACKDKALGVDGFREFARLLGIAVTGTKAAMLKQFKDAIDQMAVSRAQTKF